MSGLAFSNSAFSRDEHLVEDEAQRILDVERWSWLGASAWPAVAMTSAASAGGQALM